MADGDASPAPAKPARGRSCKPRALIDGLLGRLDLRAKSLIVTVYGDAVMPHGGSCWLGSLIRLVEPLGLSERMVRTAVFRLAQDGLLTATQIGRRSYYALTQDGRRQFESAQRRIYSMPESDWDRRWLFVLLTDDAPAERREALKKELTWQGFAALAPNLLAHAAGAPAAAHRAIEANGLADHAVALEARAGEAAALRPLQRLVAGAWQLDRMDAQYREFLESFRPVYRALEQNGAPAPAEAFLLRVLLIHDYRRVLLRDPGLPPELLPPDWSGLAANLLCRNLYRLLAAPAERHVMAALETSDGPLPDAAPYFFERFGGIG